MGKSYDPQVTAQFGVYDDKKMQAFITRKGLEMARISHRSHLDFSFKVVDSPVINAFAVPGGYIYFTRGIMAHFNNEAQFAGVLGHEIGWVLGAQDLPHFDVMECLTLLDPQGTNVDMPELAGSFAICDR